MNREGQWIIVELDEHEAALRELRPGWNILDCAGDDLLKRLYLEQELTKSDKRSWYNGMVTEHCQEAIDQIGGLEGNEVMIEYSRENRRYKIVAVE